MIPSELTPTTVARSLAHALDLGLSRLDAQMLLLHALGQPGCDRAWLLVHDSQALTAAQQGVYATYVQRCLSGEPLAYITGHRYFFDLDLAVDPRALIPRSDSETLVQWALEILAHTVTTDGLTHVLDLGTGSGAIALAIKAVRPDLIVSAVDASNAALKLARENARRLQLDVQFRHGSWLDDVAEQFDIIASNPPYIGASDPHLAELRHEPLQALVSGADGLDDIRQITDQAGTHLKPGGWLLLEHGYNQATAVRELLRQAGFDRVQSRHDLSGIERCSGGQWASQHSTSMASTCKLLPC